MATCPNCDMDVKIKADGQPVHIKRCPICAGPLRALDRKIELNRNDYGDLYIEEADSEYSNSQIMIERHEIGDFMSRLAPLARELRAKYLQDFTLAILKLFQELPVVEEVIYDDRDPGNVVVVIKDWNATMSIREFSPDSSTRVLLQAVVDNRPARGRYRRGPKRGLTSHPLGS